LSNQNTYVNSQTLWSFIVFVLNDYNSNEELDADGFILNNKNTKVNNDTGNKLESIARKEFKSIYNQIIQQNKQTSSTNGLVANFNDSSINSDDSSSNYALEWINVSLRQHNLLNQLAYLLSDEALLKQYYKPNSFLLDRSFVDDFLIYIRAYEHKNYDILNKIKRNFFQLQPQPQPQLQSIPNLVGEPGLESNTSRVSPVKRHIKQNSADLTLLMNSKTISPGASNSQTELSYNRTFELNKSNNDLKNSDQSSLTNSIIELKINELNSSPRVQQHRRMHSFPNIQVNLLKKNSMMAAAAATNTSSNNSATNAADFSNASSTPNDDKNVLNRIDSSSELRAEEDAKIPKLVLNNETKDIDDLIDNQQSTNAYKQADIYEKTDILDLIHAVQINCECSPLDKENSHFIMADLTIAAIELMKTQQLEDELFDEDKFSLNKANDPMAHVNRSNYIRINNKSVSSSNIISSLDNSASNSFAPTMQNSPQQLFFTLDEFTNGSFSPSTSSINTQDPLFLMNNSSSNFSEPHNKKYRTFSNDNKPKLSKSVSSSHYLIDISEVADPLSEENNFQTEKAQSELKNKLNTNSMNFQLSTDSAYRSDYVSTSPILEPQPNELLSSINLSQDFDKSLVISSSFDSSKFSNLKQSASSSQLTQDSSLQTSTSSSTSTVVMRKKLTKNHSFTKPVINEDGFEIVDKEHSNKKVKDSSKVKKLSQSTRERRFSWEKIEIDTAERISARLIETVYTHFDNFLKLKIPHKNGSISSRQSSMFLKLPHLRLFEFFIQYLEYDEYMQTYFELRNSGKLKKYNTSFAENAAALSLRPSSTLNPSMSASSLYLSNSSISMSSSTTSLSQIASTTATNNRTSLFGSRLKSSTSPKSKSNFSKPLSSTSFLKVKSASIAAASAAQIHNLETSKVNDYSGDETASISSSFAFVDKEKKSELIRQISTNLENLSNNGELLSLSTSPTQSIASQYKTLNAARIIGDETWAPVREQLILNYHPKLKRFEQMQQQHFRCADCGIQVRPDQIKTFYYCEYFSKYFCRCCHINNQSYIPAYIVNLLDFRSTFEVSKKAKNFLEKIYKEPLITLESINPSLFEHNSIFLKIQKIRIKLYNSRSYINSCRFASELKEELNAQFDDFIINDYKVYSIETLFKIKKTNYYEQLKQIAIKIIEHIKNCELCSQLGYICGMCNKNDLLYPFDFDKVEKCPNCLACYHRNCLKNPDQCPRCIRKRNRIQSSATNISQALAS
jgi:hypothetical protein